jgi:hypothetical protein
MNEGVNESSLNRRRQHDFPTPESPINNSLIYDTKAILGYQIIKMKE